MADDPYDDLEVLEELATGAGGELFTYDGAGHLFTDRSVEEYDPHAARLVLDRTLDFLGRLS